MLWRLWEVSRAVSSHRTPEGAGIVWLFLCLWLSMSRVCFGDVFPSIFFVVIEMSIFCGCEFFNHPFGCTSLEDTEITERGGELRIYFSLFIRTS